MAANLEERMKTDQGPATETRLKLELDLQFLRDGNPDLASWNEFLLARMESGCEVAASLLH